MNDEGPVLTDNAAAQAFDCPQCGGDMRFSPASGALVCSHCAHAMAVGETGGSQVIVEYALSEGLARQAPRGYGTDTRTVQCQECGAVVSFGAAETATACEFCGSSQVLEQGDRRNVLRPESVVPFLVGKDVADGSFATWLGKLWFRPSDLKRKARVSEMRGVYVPYWTFDAQVRSSWTAQAGYYYYVTESYTETDASGNTVRKTRQVRKIRWEPAWGARGDHYDDLLVCASRGLPGDLVSKLRTFDTGSLQPYEPGYLAGWKAEEYAVDLDQAWQQAVAEMEATQRTRCARDVPGDTHRGLRVVNRFSDERFKHVLLPIWISAYRYRDKVYRFLVNGQTGEVTGHAPYSFWKIFLLVLLCAGILAVIVYLYMSRGQ